MNNIAVVLKVYMSISLLLKQLSKTGKKKQNFVTALIAVYFSMFSYERVLHTTSSQLITT